MLTLRTGWLAVKRGGRKEGTVELL